MWSEYHTVNIIGIADEFVFWAKSHGIGGRFNESEFGQHVHWIYVYCDSSCDGQPGTALSHIKFETFQFCYWVHHSDSQVLLKFWLRKVRTQSNRWWTALRLTASNRPPVAKVPLKRFNKIRKTTYPISFFKAEKGLSSSREEQVAAFHSDQVQSKRHHSIRLKLF